MRIRKLPIEEFYDKIMFNHIIEEGENVKKNIRKFETGATRDTNEGKLDYEGFFSPLVLEEYAKYMHKNRKQSDGKMRDSDNWQKGIPLRVYMKSLWRHFMDLWKQHRGIKCQFGFKEALCGIIFNSMGYLHEILKKEKKSS